MGPPRGNQPGVMFRSFAGGKQGWGMPVMARKKGERRVRGLVPGRERGECAVLSDREMQEVELGACASCFLDGFSSLDGWRLDGSDRVQSGDPQAAISRLTESGEMNRRGLPVARRSISLHACIGRNNGHYYSLTPRLRYVYTCFHMKSFYFFPDAT
jgi:hypothetical protein